MRFNSNIFSTTVYPTLLVVLFRKMATAPLGSERICSTLFSDWTIKWLKNQSENFFSMTIRSPLDGGDVCYFHCHVPKTGGKTL